MKRACEVQFLSKGRKYLFVRIVIFLACMTVLTIFYVIHSGYFVDFSRCIRQISSKSAVLVSESHSLHISSVFQNFPLDLYKNAMINNDTDEIHSILEHLINELSDFLVLEPHAKINQTCSAPSFEVTEVNCSKYPDGFTSPRDRTLSPVKIGILLQFGFDVDGLEIYLNELYDIVDLFFITEATNSHYNDGALKKPLIWEKIKDQGRFVKFVDKIVHFVIDDADVSKVKQGKHSGNKFTMENMQERLRWTKFLEWNTAWNFFGEDDILAFGDADEIPSRSSVLHFRHCNMKFPVLDVGIWFPFGNINFAYPSDFPVRGHPYTLGDPTFWELWAAEDYFNSTQNPAPSRQRGKSPGFILGGIHMTHSGYLPFQIIKRITQSEGGPLSIEQITNIVNAFQSEPEDKKMKIRDLEIELAAVPEEYARKIVNLSEISNAMKEIAVLPWFYDCYRGRYPMWEGNHDSRID